jgi:hypothetical protein
VWVVVSLSYLVGWVGREKNIVPENALKNIMEKRLRWNLLNLRWPRDGLKLTLEG